jgi:hypothetical protein
MCSLRVTAECVDMRARAGKKIKVKQLIVLTSRSDISSSTSNALGACWFRLRVGDCAHSDGDQQHDIDQISQRRRAKKGQFHTCLKRDS